MSNEDGTRFEDLLAELVASFVNVEPDALDARLEDALGKIVRFLGIDRGTAGRFDDEHRRLTATHSWAAAGIEPLPSPLLMSDFPYLIARMRAGKPIIVERIDQLPAEAATDIASLNRIGLRSMAVFPLTAEGKPLGWLSLGATRKRRAWPSALLPRLRLIGEVFSNALLRRQKDNALRLALAENVALRKRLESENAIWREEVLQCRDFDEVVGVSAPLHRVMTQIEQVAPTDSSVLLLGETGTGKDLIATSIHRQSRRAERLLVRVNCAALPATLMESELFGHEKGAFTGALARRPGRFELADRGTVVLDEIGELPLELQPKLLRVLQSGEFERLGSSETRRTDVRVIASTNRDLTAMVNAGTFRADLFYRISVFPITIPPLRERREDIPLLAAYFVEKLRARLGRKVIRVPERILDRLTAYWWPGNVRELENIIERSMIVSSGVELVLEGIPESAVQSAAVPPIRTDGAPTLTLAEMEREHIQAVCAACGWRINGKGNAAERLGVKPNTLRSRMQRLGVKRPTCGAATSTP